MRSDRIKPTANISPDECLIGPKEVAQLSGMTPRWVQESFRNEVLPIKIGGRLRWPLWQVKAWVADQAAKSGVYE